MERIRLDLSKTGSSVASYGETAEKFNALLDNATGRGIDFLGWVHLPSSITEEELNAVEAAATILRER